MKCNAEISKMQNTWDLPADLLFLCHFQQVISEYKKTPHPKLCPPTSVSTAAECSVDQIYENICCSRGTANSKHSPANVQEKHNINSTMCRTPLPPKIPERSSDGAFGKRTNKPTTARNMTSKPKKSRTSNTSACQSRSSSDSKEERPPSLWFGLNLSGTSWVELSWVVVDKILWIRMDSLQKGKHRLS